MAMDTNVRGFSSGRGVEVDTQNRLLVALSQDPTLAAHIQTAYLRDAATSRVMRVTPEGEAYGASSRLMFASDFNGATLLNNQWNTQATTMAVALTAGFLRLNSGAITTTNTGASVSTARSFVLEDGMLIRLKGRIRHSNAAVANKQAEFGIGMYQVAANQAGATVEFVGFRWTVGGNLQGIVEYSTGGAPVTLTTGTAINGGVPHSDNVSREYEVVVTASFAEFWIEGLFVAAIPLPADGPGLTKGAGYPVIARLFIGTAAPLAPIFDIGDVSVYKVGAEADIPVAYRQALMGRSSFYPQTGLAGANGNTAANVVSGTAPTAATGSNTSAALTGLGGFYALNAASLSAANANVIVNAFQNPAFPIAAGAANNGRNLVITDLNVSPLVCSTALTGGGAVVEWFAAIGNTAVSQATTDAAGTTALGSKSPRIIPLGTVDVSVAAQAAGTVCARTGSGTFSFTTPLVVHPGEFISVGLRVLQFGAAATAGVYSGGVGFGGYWD